MSEHDPNTESPAKFEADPVNNQETVKPQKPTLREQMDHLSFLVNAGVYWAISSMTFPNVPPDRLYAEVVQAHDNNNARIQWARFLIQDPEAFKKLEVNTTRIIKDSEKMLGGLSDMEGEIDHQLLRRQMVVRQNAEANRTMDEVIIRGLVEELSERNFPVLRAMEPVSRYKLYMDTVRNRIEDLQRHQAMYEKPKYGHTKNTNQDPTRGVFSKQILDWQRVHGLLAEKYDEAQKKADWKIPELD